MFSHFSDLVFLVRIRAITIRNKRSLSCKLCERFRRVLNCAIDIFHQLILQLLQPQDLFDFTLSRLNQHSFWSMSIAHIRLTYLAPHRYHLPWELLSLVMPYCWMGDDLLSLLNLHSFLLVRFQLFFFYAVQLALSHLLFFLHLYPFFLLI